MPTWSSEIVPRRGRSLQSYMRDWVVDFANRPTPAEALEEMAAARKAGDTPAATTESILADLAEDRR